MFPRTPAHRRKRAPDPRSALSFRPSPEAPARRAAQPPSRAVRTALTLAAAYPADRRALVNAAWTLAGHGRPAEAEALLHRALALDPDYWHGLNVLGELRLSHGDAAAAEALFRRALRARPETPHLLKNLARALYRQNRLTETETVAGRALRLNPGDPEAYWLVSLSRRPAGGRWPRRCGR